MLDAEPVVAGERDLVADVFGREQVDVGLAEDHEQVAGLPVFFRSSAMCRSAFMRALSTARSPAC